MLGLVLWCDVNGTTAVIWCEDQGELAFLNGREDVIDTDILPKVGDLVHFRISDAAGCRRAYNLRVLAEDVVPDLPDRLQTTLAELASAPQLARVG